VPTCVISGFAGKAIVSTTEGIRIGDDAIAAAVLNPSEEDARMPGAVERFGLMSRLNLPDDRLKATVLFLAAGDFA